MYGLDAFSMNLGLSFCFLVEVGASVVTRRSGVFSLDVSVADHCRAFPSKTHHEISFIIKFASVVLNDVHPYQSSFQDPG